MPQEQDEFGSSLNGEEKAADLLKNEGLRYQGTEVSHKCRLLQPSVAAPSGHVSYVTGHGLQDQVMSEE